MRVGGIIAGLALLAALAVGGGWWLSGREPTTPVIDPEAGADLAAGLPSEMSAPDQVGAAPSQAAVLPVGEGIALPSGRVARWLDSAQDTLGPAGLTFRYRFVADGLVPDMPEQALIAVQQDITALCNVWVVPRVARPGPLPSEVVITLMDRPTVFGETDAGVVQMFEAYSLAVAPDAPTNARIEAPSTPLICRWELY